MFIVVTELSLCWMCLRNAVPVHCRSMFTAKTVTLHYGNCTVNTDSVRSLADESTAADVRCEPSYCHPFLKTHPILSQMCHHMTSHAHIYTKEADTHSPVHFYPPTASPKCNTWHQGESPASLYYLRTAHRFRVTGIACKPLSQPVVDPNYPACPPNQGGTLPVPIMSLWVIWVVGDMSDLTCCYC